MKIQALWVITYNALQEGIAVLGGAKAGFHLLASPHSTIDNLNTSLSILRSLESDVYTARGPILGSR